MHRLSDVLQFFREAVKKNNWEKAVKKSQHPGHFGGPDRLFPVFFDGYPNHFLKIASLKIEKHREKISLLTIGKHCIVKTLHR